MLYCATTNPGKLREFMAIVGAVEPLPTLREIPPPEETGATFEENAAAKAIYYSRFCDGPIFVDDSGLEVNALAGAPGVHSARYAGPDATDQDNNRLVVERMRGRSDRSCRFVCVIALANRGGIVATFRGEVEGQLLEAPRGPNGFGYDPLFYYPPFASSFGEIDPSHKAKVSHRARALQLLQDWLSRHDLMR